MADSAIANLAAKLQTFAKDRDWDRFHSPKNLAMALVGEAGELAAEFQWINEGDSYRLDTQQMERVQLEAADIFLYLIRLADRLDFDLVEAAQRKLELNAKRYPAEQVRGSSKKYSEY